MKRTTAVLAVLVVTLHVASHLLGPIGVIITHSPFALVAYLAKRRVSQ